MDNPYEGKPTLLITGNSSGLGRGLTEIFLERGWAVYGCSRRGYADAHVAELRDSRCDLANLDAIPDFLQALLGNLEQLRLVILNAGVLGEIKLMHKTSLPEIQRIMDINVWANKIILDWLHAWGRPVAQIVLITSGASVLGNKGWGAYALSKASLNMLARLYAHEFPGTHIAALAPGLIDTAMMDYLCAEADANAFPALRRLREARGTERMPEPQEAAEKVYRIVPQLKKFPSGRFIDIRQILAPAEYAALMKAKT